MARSTRIDFENTYYHVLSRGNEKRPIFIDNQDYHIFKEQTKEMVNRFSIEVHAYVLMTNHYHLLIKTRQQNLSRSMQWLGQTYASQFNRRHQRCGHLFQGRFKSFVVENEHYLNSLCLYIHRNPIRAKMVAHLSDYQWSSYPVYIGKFNEEWLTTDLILGLYGNDRQKFINTQLHYAKQEEQIFDDLRYGLFFGSESFADTYAAKLKEEEHPEKPQIRAAFKKMNIFDVTRQVLLMLDVDDIQSILKPLRREKRPKRDIAIYILVNLGIYTNQEIGNVFGVGYTSISGAIKRAVKYFETDDLMKKQVLSILNDI